MLRICPQCHKAFYKANDKASIRCNHCGYVLLERRGAQRIKKELVFYLCSGKKEIPARLKDYSEGGLRATYPGSVIHTKVIKVNIDELNIHRRAQAVWTKRVSRSVYSIGLRFT